MLVYNQTTFAILCFFSAAVAIVSTVLLKVSCRKKTKNNCAAALFTFFSGVWSFVVGMIWLNININSQTTMFWTKVSYYGAFLSVLLIIFLYSFFDKKISFLKKIVLSGIVLIAATFKVLTVSKYEDLVTGVPIFFNFHKLVILLLMIYILVLIITNYRRLTGIRKLQFQYTLLGLGITCIAVILFIVVLPYLLHNNLLFVYLPPFFLLWILPVTYSLSIPKLHAFEVAFYDLIKSIVLLTVFFAVYFSIMAVFRGIFLFSEIFSEILSILIAGTLFFFTPLKERFSVTMKKVILKKRINYESILIECSKKVTGILDIDELLQYVIETFHNSFGVKKICIFLKENFSKKDSKFKLQRISEIGNVKCESDTYFTNTKILGWLNTHKEPLVLDREYLNLSKNDFEELTLGFDSINVMLIVPIINKEVIIGFIIMDQKHVEGNIFDIDDIQLIQGLSNQLGIAIENAILYKELDNAYLNITRSLAIAVETKEGYTLGHSDNVTKYAVAIAKKRNLPLEQIITVAHSAMLHDLGKIGIHDSILCKPDKLTDEEWEEMRTHPVKGAKILEPLPFMKDVIEIVKHHHEKYNGEGYPDNLKKDHIPIGSQILCVADSFDAMISSRPYRVTDDHKFTVEKAIQELINNKNTQFNPEIVDAFIEILKENPNIVRTVNLGVAKK